MLIFIIFTIVGCSRPNSTQALKTEFDLKDGKINLQEISVLSDKVEILIPKGFSIMSGEMAKIKYPSERRPTLIYTNESATINIAFNHTESKASNGEIQSYKDSLEKTFKNLNPSAKWYSSDVLKINSRNVGCLEFLTPALDTRIYNLIFFTELDGRLLLISFNCTEAQMNDWKPIAINIMNSLNVKE